MSRTAQDIMNRELLSVTADSRADETLEMILEYGITAVPVLDADGRPVGVTSLRDLARMGPSKAPMTKPATTVAANASIESVAETMATTNRHHLVVVGSDGKAVGMVSTLDVIRAMLGRPATHPSTFPGHDAHLGGWWSSDEVLADSNVLATVPEEAGVLLLLHGGVGSDERPAWAEGPPNLRLRVRELVRDPATLEPALAAILSQGRILFRYSIVSDRDARSSLVQRLRDRISKIPPPGAT